MAKLAAKVYGDALFSLAIEENKLDEMWAEVKSIRRALSENPEFFSIIGHPELPVEKKQAMADEIFDKQSGDMKAFLHILLQKRRFGEILSIFDYFDEQAKKYRKIGVVDVSTPYPLDDKKKEQIENRLLEVTGYESLEMNYRLDKELLGGIVIRIGDRILDNSIRSKLDDMTRKLGKVRVSGG